MTIPRNWTNMTRAMERINHLWHRLENCDALVPGLFKLRYSDSSKCDVFLGIKVPEMYRMIILKVPFSIGKDFNFRYEFRGLKFEKAYDSDDSECLLLNLVLIDRQYEDVFDTLVADLVDAIINETEVKSILRNYVNRLTKWQSLFEKFNPLGLTPEAQRGLFGELLFLKAFLGANADFQNVVNSWVGPAGEVRDFQFGRWSVEVKTTHGNNHQRVYISSERQLDTWNLDHLFLYHVSLDIRQQSGETLNELVDAIIDTLAIDLPALTAFRSKLMEAGYFQHHRPLYAGAGYFIRQDSYYRVGDSFPRIEEGDISEGVGDVKYSIIVSKCFEHSIPATEVFDKLSFG